ncbi:hypothetical protein [Alkalibacterium sp. 20]|uniref:hypothetical protein n=1 Tax=Alkalibacterium sp. 20 TaxID=1798803 RepID=UPI00091A415A|nr:hypothetical protein [Alkalibacterium sp. 20]OJF95787.1 hypothetical protein AX762_06140 [Alkalibacterium sp. 20]
MDEETERKNIPYHKNLYFKMPEEKQLQALIKADSMPSEYDAGLAVGMIVDYHDYHYILLPGQPEELRSMVKNHVKDELIKHILTEQVLVSRVLRF